MEPNAMVAKITIHTYTLRRSAHSRTETRIDPRIITPPMVGVPVLARWDCGPSVLTTCPYLSLCSSAITLGPTSREITIVVRIAITARNERYETTLNTVRYFVNHSERRTSIIHP